MRISAGDEPVVTESIAYSYDAAGNRSQMTVTGSENYTTVYAYDSNNRLLTEAKTENGETVTTTYTYDANGNTLTVSTPAHGVEEAVIRTNSYNRFNQQTGVITNGIPVAQYTYNAQGIRTSKTAGAAQTHFLLDGGNVVAEIQGETTTNYLRGINLISKAVGDDTEYYLFNAHGDVVNLTNSTGTATRSYDYDAFGNEHNPDAADENPFRYCGEYYDTETGTYYLRARYYDPAIGRFTQADTHWNTTNMIYGDNPQKINEREDKLGLKYYSYAPQITAIMQAGNLYVYCKNDSGNYIDLRGLWTISISLTLGAVLGMGISGSIGISIDENWNFELQYSYVVPGVDNTNTVGAIGVAMGLAIQYTRADSVYQLHGPATYVGANAGPWWYVGGDLISFEDASKQNTSVDGIQVVAGIGAGLDVHVSESYTRSFNETEHKSDLVLVSAPSSFGCQNPNKWYYNVLN